MQLFYSSFSHVPALQQVGLYTEPGSLLLCSVPGLVSIARWSQLKLSWERCLQCPAEWGTPPTEPTSAFSGWGYRSLAIALHGLCCSHWATTCKANTSCVSLKEWVFWCLPLGRSPGVGQRSPGVREECAPRPDPKRHVLAMLGCVPHVILRLACRSLKHCPYHTLIPTEIEVPEFHLTAPYLFSLILASNVFNTPFFCVTVSLHMTHTVSSPSLTFYFFPVFVLFWDGGQ